MCPHTPLCFLVLAEAAAGAAAISAGVYSFFGPLFLCSLELFLKSSEAAAISAGIYIDVLFSLFPAAAADRQNKKKDTNTPASCGRHAAGVYVSFFVLAVCKNQKEAGTPPPY
jgi:hypothetical protein